MTMITTRRALLAIAMLAAAASASAQDTKAKAPATKTSPAATKAADTKAPAQPGLTVAPAQDRPRVPVVLRELYDYDAEGRRDPFFTLLASAELRPAITDLRLVGITYDPSGRRSIATMRDIQTQARYNVTTGTTLGRLKVVLIRPKAVIFSVEEFGLNRQDSLVLGDTNRVRIR
jgi:hypothetical protein